MTFVRLVRPANMAAKNVFVFFGKHFLLPRLAAIFTLQKDRNMDNQKVPTKQGQIVKIRNPYPDENPAEAYLVTEDVSVYSDDATIYIVSITELQRNIAHPALSQRKAVTKSELALVAEDLKSFIESFNEL